MRRLFRVLALVLTLMIMLPPGLLPLAAQEASPVATPATQGDPLIRATEWLKTQQAPDGGFIGFSGASDPGTTADAVLALAAAGQRGVPVDLTAAVDYLRANAERYADTGAGQAAKLVLALVAAGSNPRDINGFDAVNAMDDDLDEESGVYGFGVYDTCLALLAEVATGDQWDEQSIEALQVRQIADGSWAYDGTTDPGAGDSNTTAICVQALVAAGETDSDLVMKGLEYFMAIQRPQGFPFQLVAGSMPDANSTSLVIQALIAAGQDPTSQEWQNVLMSLTSFQNSSGAFRYMAEPPDDNLYATLQAIPALAGLAFPILPGADGASQASPVSAASPVAAVLPTARREAPWAA